METLLGSSQLLQRPSRLCCNHHRQAAQPTLLQPIHKADSASFSRQGPTWVPSATDTKQEAPQQKPPAEPEVQVDGVEALPVNEVITLLRGTCSTQLKYEIEYGLKRGTSDNSYLLKEEAGTTLIDVPDQSYKKHFVERLQSIVSLDSISTLVLTHLTPKRLPTLQALLQARGTSQPLEVYLSNPAHQLLRSKLGESEEGSSLLSALKLNIAKTGSGQQAGKTGSLILVPAPTPRWPDLLCAYSRTHKMMFTSKLFCAHVSQTAIAQGAVADEGGWDVYGRDWQHYFDCMLAPVARQASNALDKLEITAAEAQEAKGVASALSGALQAAQGFLEQGQLRAFGDDRLGVSPLVESREVECLAPMHGPLVHASMAELLRMYRQWIADQRTASAQCAAAVMYASAYGNTAALAQAISRGITKAGVGVETLNLENEELDSVLSALKRCKGFVIGSPTLGGHMPTQVSTALGAVLREEGARERPCGVFGSFGWSGEAVDELQSRLKDGGFQLVFDPVKVKFKPTAKDMQVAEESGTDLAQAMLKSQRREQRQAGSTQKSGSASDTEQAVGRVLGSLCAITSRDDDAESAMLASWISQASFNPPGLTVSVKKDRAVESMLTPGRPFVVNILAQGKDKGVMKQLLKPFKPGEDRFQGLETEESEENGCRVLKDSAAYLDCQVLDKMPAGDHWVVYAHIKQGKVLQDSAMSAVHHRKTGTSY